ncbi:MAG: hypothetical protein RDU24_03195 [Humidesulfovibrio sp.]|uniref:hypothetical protein n=1 Tax=Humidesulfovibrio sp. TaxID=2910988 RepID=UPI0027E60275|nr:hypothetical protein [Humidesulfovibrio sp.]MDQ7834366.1 hypothetical protein [Humidesulfovibrio sp.]
MTWQRMARLTHLTASAQRRLWRILVLAWGVGLIAAWAVLSAFTRVAEKAYEDAGQTYVAVAPLAAEIMDLRKRHMALGNAAPLQAAEQVAQSAGIGPERLRILPLPGIQGPERLSMTARGLNLRELVDVLRDLRLQAGLSTESGHIFLRSSTDKRVDLELVLAH